MAKKLNGIILKIAVALMVIFLTAVFAAGGFYVLTDYRLGAVEIEATKKDEEGCKPALQNKLNIALIQMSMSNMQTDQTEIKDEQKAMRKEFQVGLEEILRRLPPTD